MAEFAPVVPIDIAAQMKEHRCLGSYHLLLAHDVVKHPKEYKEVYNSDGFNHFIIMDNSVVELKKPVDLQMVYDACEIVNATCAVMPDYLLDGPATYKATMDASDKWQSMSRKSMMVLPQGKNVKEWIDTAENLLQHREFRYVGIPRNVKEKLQLSRIDAVRIIHMMDLLRSTRRYHLFGFSNDLWDDIAAITENRDITQLMGIDSNVPIRQGCLEQVIDMRQGDPGPRGDWWDSHSGLTATARDNVRRFRTWIR